MYVLTLTLCLAVSPGICHVERLPFAQDGGLQDCAIGGQYRAIDYLRVHPDLILTGWSCELPKT
ncbi:MAG: hypothetical protein U1E53_27495 [Dongiaceae bacterium]